METMDHVLRTTAAKLAAAGCADDVVEDLAERLPPQGVIVVSVDDGDIPSISTLAALDRLFARHGLLIVDVERLPGCHLLAVQHHDACGASDGTPAAISAA